MGSAFFGAKPAVDAGRRGGTNVQAIILFLKGEPPDFFVLAVVKGSNDF
jgi:hypothetical protein